MVEIGKLLSDHPKPAPSLIGRLAVGDVERDLLYRGAGVAQRYRGCPADAIDFRFDADAGDVGDISDAQALHVLRVGDDGTTTGPWPPDRDRRATPKTCDRVQHQRGIF